MMFTENFRVFMLLLLLFLVVVVVVVVPCCCCCCCCWDPQIPMMKQPRFRGTMEDDNEAGRVWV